MPARPRVIIIGGGFGGLQGARRLRRAPVDVVVIDRRNHHVFQPLLYQVATAALSPAQIAQPIRHMLQKQANARVILGEVVAINPERRTVQMRDGGWSYDYLIVAAGSRPSYFGHGEWKRAAPPLKTINNAIEIRRRFLLAFEAAELEHDPAARRAELTFVVVGGGPTGVELAGAMAEIAHSAMPRDFRAIDTTTARVILIEAHDRVLAHFAPEASRRALAGLRSLGVEVRLNTRATDIDEHSVQLHAADGATERIGARSVIWAAGVHASGLGAFVGAPEHDGRIRVDPDLSVPGHPEIFVIGDVARAIDTRTGAEAPGLAPAAMQMGRFVGRLLERETRALARGEAAPPRPEFHYVDKGELATIGRAKAVATFHGWTIGGLPAWLLWAGVHVFFLIGFRNRLAVVFEWAWEYVTWQRGARLITGESSAGASNRAPRDSAPEAGDG